MVDDIIGFFDTVNTLKWTKRRGWVAKVNVKEPESVADHCYMTALMCMVLADLKGLDSAKAVKIALLHDVAESVLGDYMPGEISSKKKREDAVAKNLLKKLPAGIRRQYEKLWTEYRKGTSKEAILVREIDKLEMAHQAKDYLKKGYRPALLEQFFDSAATHVRDKKLLGMIKGLKHGRT